MPRMAHWDAASGLVRAWIEHSTSPKVSQVRLEN